MAECKQTCHPRVLPLLSHGTKTCYKIDNRQCVARFDGELMGIVYLYDKACTLQETQVARARAKDRPLCSATW